MPTTPLGIPYPALTDGPNGPSQMQALAAAVDALLTGIESAWTAYSPTWSAAGSAPAIGNGILAGRYRQVGKLIIAQWYLNPGSTTTFGSGVYTFALPLSTSASQQGNAVGSIFAANAGNYYTSGVVYAAASASTAVPFLPGSTTSSALSQVSPTVPWTIKANDIFNCTLIYEAA